MSHEFEDFATESAHAAQRERKRRGPKVIMDNPGLRPFAAHLADKLKAKIGTKTQTAQLGEK